MRENNNIENEKPFGHLFRGFLTCAHEQFKIINKKKEQRVGVDDRKLMEVG